jgi:hypothetical protein
VSERCFVKVAWDPASSGLGVRRAVGGFLRYIQHRDLHPDSSLERPGSAVAGMVKYVAYREGASPRAELFCPDGRAGSRERQEFAAYVGRSIEESKPQLFRSGDGRLMDRRRAVYRFIISPETAQGLDLERLLRQAAERLTADTGAADLRWLAAIHRNTAHHHIHLVIAGMHRDASGAYRRVDISKVRLASIKEALALEIERQRCERTASPLPAEPAEESVATAPHRRPQPVFEHPVQPPNPGRRVAWRRLRSPKRRIRPPASTPLLRGRVAARWLASKSARDVADEARDRGWEYAA